MKILVVVWSILVMGNIGFDYFYSEKVMGMGLGGVIRGSKGEKENKII